MGKKYKSFDEEEREEQEAFRRTLSPFMRIADSWWQYLLGLAIVCLVAFTAGIGIGLIL